MINKLKAVKWCIFLVYQCNVLKLTFYSVLVNFVSLCARKPNYKKKDFIFDSISIVSKQVRSGKPIDLELQQEFHIMADI